MTTLTYEQIMNALKGTRNGCMVRIGYKTALPMTAAAKRAGKVVYKLTEVTVRFGVDYDNIGAVIKKKSLSEASTTDFKNAYEWVIKDKACYNGNTDKTYIRFANVNGGANRRVAYIGSDGQRTASVTDADMEFVLPSYWSKKAGGCPEVQNVAFENVVRIGNIGEKLF